MKINTIYIIKCIGILLIVAEHAITYQQPDYYDNPFITMVKAFSMPAFMVLSGFVVSNKPLNDKWINGKFLTNGIILIITAIGYYTWFKLLPNHSMLKLETPMSLLDFMAYNLYSGFAILVTWYIYVMLVCYIVLSGVWRIKDKWKHLSLTWLVILAIVLINVVPMFSMGLSLIKWYGTFMLVGYLIGTHRDKLRKFLWLSYAGIPTFIISGVLTDWMRNWQDLEYGRGGYTNIVGDILVGRVPLLLVMVASVILGVLALVGVARAIEHIKPIQKPLVYIGVNVLGIYLLHPFFVGLVQNVAVTITIGVFGSLILYTVGQMAVKWYNNR